MGKQLITNECGEPIGYEYVRDQFEEEEAEWEEMNMRAEDPMYAAQCEKESWYLKACRIFEAEGIEVPEQVKRILADELRAKRMKEEEERKLAKAMPTVELFNKFYPNLVEAYYVPPTPDEYGYVEIRFNDYAKIPYRDEVEHIFELAEEQGIDVEDYISRRDFDKR